MLRESITTTVRSRAASHSDRAPARSSERNEPGARAAGLSAGMLGKRASSRAESANVAASRTKHPRTPSQATKAPATPGPRILVTWAACELSAFAAKSWPRGNKRGMAACCAGLKKHATT